MFFAYFGIHQFPLFFSVSSFSTHHYSFPLLRTRGPPKIWPLTYTTWIRETVKIIVKLPRSRFPFHLLCLACSVALAFPPLSLCGLAGIYFSLYITLLLPLRSPRPLFVQEDGAGAAKPLRRHHHTNHRVSISSCCSCRCCRRRRLACAPDEKLRNL